MTQFQILNYCSNDFRDTTGTDCYRFHVGQIRTDYTEVFRIHQLPIYCEFHRQKLHAMQKAEKYTKTVYAVDHEADNTNSTHNEYNIHIAFISNTKMDWLIWLRSDSFIGVRYR